MYYIRIYVYVYAHLCLAVKGDDVLHDFRIVVPVQALKVGTGEEVDGGVTRLLGVVDHLRVE